MQSTRKYEAGAPFSSSQQMMRLAESPGETPFDHELFLFLSLSFVLAPFLFRNYYFLGTLTGDNIFESYMSNA